MGVLGIVFRMPKTVKIHSFFSVFVPSFLVWLLGRDWTDFESWGFLFLFMPFQVCNVSEFGCMEEIGLVCNLGKLLSDLELYVLL